MQRRRRSVSCAASPRLPLEASIDLTYRCSNRCRHCWLWAADTPDERAAELTTDEWRAVVDQARALGTRRWSISGGEPMLREDFSELFDYVTRKAVGYSLNTNGALITPQIAQLLTRKGNKMVALYGATAEVHDHVTRTPGSFDATMEGFARLRRPGPASPCSSSPCATTGTSGRRMKDLAASLSPHWRVGAAWLFMSACGDAARNAEIARQRLDPADVIALDEPVPADDAAWPRAAADVACGGVRGAAGDDRVYARCIEGRRDLHVDPYGGVAHCSFIKDPALRFSLRGAGGIAPGALERIWEEELPAVADRACGGVEYLEGCASCDLRDDCRWCGVYGYLEHGRHGAKVEYLCEVAKEARRFKDDWRREHRRTWQIGGMTVQVDADRPIAEDTFSGSSGRSRRRMRTARPPAPTACPSSGSGTTSACRICDGRELGREVYRRPPWADLPAGLVVGLPGHLAGRRRQGVPGDLHRVVTFNDDHTRARIYNDVTRSDAWARGGLASVTMFPTDQILLARVLADRDGLFLHSGAVVLDGAGLLLHRSLGGRQVHDHGTAARSAWVSAWRCSATTATSCAGGRKGRRRCRRKPRDRPPAPVSGSTVRGATAPCRSSRRRRRRCGRSSSCGRTSATSSCR